VVTITLKGSQMPHRKRKVRKMRGSRTHGWGRVAQHRKGGSRGGRGRTGLANHKKSWMIKHQPDHFGRHGFKRPWVEDIEVINVGELDEMVESLLSEGRAERKEKKIFIDLDAMGVDKLLGYGTVTQPLVVKVRTYSERAGEKIAEAGGQILSIS